MTGAKSDVVLVAEHVSKKFSRSLTGQRRLIAEQLGAVAFGRPAIHKKLERGEFWSLHDINFTLRRGEILGIIGQNGAGKSTLLRVLSGLAMPDVGEVRVYGSTGVLIELGAGMKPSLSGRENIFIKGALLGKSRNEMAALYDEIAAFTELGDTIDAPVKSYSSGMRLRLGFSIAVHMRPEVLLLDEILSVGDYSFKQKCRGRINAMLENAGVVFASHSMDDIRMLSDRVMVLHGGRAVFEGPAKQAIAHYHALLEPANDAPPKRKRAPPPAAAAPAPEPPPPPPPPPPPEKAFYGELYHDQARIADISHGWVDAQGLPAQRMETWGPAQFKIKFRLLQPPRRLVVGVTVWTSEGSMMTGLATDTVEDELFDHTQLEHELILSLPKLTLNPGQYVSTVTVVDNGQALFRNLNAPFSTRTSKRRHGVVTPLHVWSVKPVAPSTNRSEARTHAESLPNETE